MIHNYRKRQFLSSPSSASTFAPSVFGPYSNVAIFRTYSYPTHTQPPILHRVHHVTNVNINAVFLPSEEFLGALLDTGAEKCVVGKRQAQLYCRYVNIPFAPRPSNAGFTLATVGRPASELLSSVYRSMTAHFSPGVSTSSPLRSHSSSDWIFWMKTILSLTMSTTFGSTKRQAGLYHSPGKQVTSFTVGPTPP